MSKPTLLEVIRSILAAAIGVQSEKNRERDFQQGSPGVYIIVGFIGTLLLILLLVIIVSFVIP